MDGVLIDVSESYRKTIAKTVQTYLETCLGFKKGSAPLITGEHIASFKMAGGFNNDWDLTSGLLLFLISISGLPPLRGQTSFASIEEISQYLRKRSSRFRWSLTKQTLQDRFLCFAEELGSCGGGLKGIHCAPTQNPEGLLGWLGLPFRRDRYDERDQTNLSGKIPGTDSLYGIIPFGRSSITAKAITLEKNL